MTQEYKRYSFRSSLFISFLLFFGLLDPCVRTGCPGTELVFSRSVSAVPRLKSAEKRRYAGNEVRAKLQGKDCVVLGLETVEQQERLYGKLRRELGADVMDALEDERTLEICVNADGRIWVERKGERLQDVGRTLSSAKRLAALGTIAAMLNILYFILWQMLGNQREINQISTLTLILLSSSGILIVCQSYGSILFRQIRMVLLWKIFLINMARF